MLRMTGPEERSIPLAPGYEQYSRSLLEVPYTPTEYGEASSDDLSSEWDSDVPESKLKPQLEVIQLNMPSWNGPKEPDTLFPP
ncbi:unnamed protein product [Nezara viridula]|uniref:Uncharacterized protein n=1 Tax=Nezara viridula TaxID=85310 RepID=A0A9P0MUH9_NEZVI|nr:unnamed protein product [Nezara viridula]